MSRRHAALLAFVLAACDGDPAPSAPAPSAPASASSPTPPVEAKADASPGDPAFDVVAEQLEIESLSPGVTWVREPVVREVLFAIASGAWTLEQGSEGTTLRVGRAPRLATRLGLRDGELVTAIDEISLRSSASARAILDRFAAGERVRVTVKRDGAEQRLFFRVSSSGRRAQDRAIDLLAAGRHDAPEPAIERGVLGESVVLADLPRVLGERALAERFELTAGGKTLVLRVVTGTVETAALEDALRALPRRPGAAPRIPEGFDPLLTPSPLDPLVEEEAIPGLEKVDDTHYRVERAVLEAMLADPSSAARLARIVPSMKDGETHGLKLYGIRRSTAGRVSLKSFGFNNGDLVTAVNGHALAGIDDAMTAYTSARKAKSLVISVERKGSPIEITIEMVEKL